MFFPLKDYKVVELFAGAGGLALGFEQADWEFQGSIGQIYRQIGNAVPVKLAYAVAQELVKSLNMHYAASRSPVVQAELSTLQKISA